LIKQLTLMKYLLIFFLSPFLLFAQAPEVPHKIHFAGMTLTIRDDARKEIQKDVNSLTQSPKHFNMRVERARTYFPIIEKVFEEEDVPGDFKYLVLQESALIPDAVSVSNAVGFWQFKDFTAVEMGLRVDKEIDERMNIVSSTRAAARYLKKNNMHFDNWLFALQAYQMGAGGVMKSEKDLRQGASHMEVTSKTYWYVKKYLAHKIAFESAVNGPGQLKVVTYQSKGKQTLKEVAREVNASEEEIVSYNKWLKGGMIPSDKTYAVVIPFSDGVDVKETEIPYLASGKTSSSKADVRAGTKSKSAMDERRTINGIYAVKARPGETSSHLARRAGLDLNKFLKYNDMTLRDKVRPGEYYFTSKKRSRAEEAYHKVESGEDVWIVSQRYGIKVNRLRRFNRMDASEVIVPGTVLYLSSMKPRNGSEPVVHEEVVRVDQQNSFNWESEATATTSSHAEQEEAPVLTPEENPTPVAIPMQSDSASVVSVDSVAVVSVVESDSVITLSVPVNDGEEQKEVPAQHVVQKGETLYGIAKTYNLEVMTLAELNQLNIQDGLKIGQTLQLKSPIDETTAQLETTEVFHEVKASDTLYSVARKYGVTIKEIMEWNAKSDFNISVGEKLKILQKATNQ
jgi:membrane-bound lytic murein transglycosylase D